MNFAILLKMKTLQMSRGTDSKPTRYTAFLLPFLLVVLAGKSQSLAKNFRQLSRPEKMWVIVHPFSATKAWKCTTRARLVTDSLQRSGVLNDGNGGQLDAYRHAYWMALLVQKISPRKAAKLGKAHEKGNYLDYKKEKTEEGTRPDSLMCEMDLRNNQSGISIGEAFKSDTATKKLYLEERVLHAVWNGQLTIAKKDAQGNYLDCSGKSIDLTLYARKWYIPKCLVRSNEIVVPH